MFAYAVHNGYQQVGSEFITHILSQYHVALQRQNKKIAWLRTHPNGDQR
jgi:phage-related protein